MVQTCAFCGSHPTLYVRTRDAMTLVVVDYVAFGFQPQGVCGECEWRLEVAEGLDIRPAFRVVE